MTDFEKCNKELCDKVVCKQKRINELLLVLEEIDDALCEFDINAARRIIAVAEEEYNTDG